MKQRNVLLNKIKHLLARVHAPRYLNKFGPKKYTLAEKVHALFLRAGWKASFVRTKKQCNSLQVKCPSKSSLHRALAALPWKWLQQMLQISAERELKLAAIDGTTLSTGGCSWHYTQRAGMRFPARKPVKVSFLIGTRTKKIHAAWFRKRVRHDILDVKHLLRQCAAKPTGIVADKGYDAEWFRSFLAEQGIACCIPIKGKAIKGWYRKRSVCDQRTYRRRPMVESSFFRFKQLFGRSVNCVTARTQRAEIFIRCILYNLEIISFRRLGTTLVIPLI